MASEKPQSRIFKIRNQLGLHARPASLFAKTASTFDAEITVQKDGNVINGKSIMGLMMLAAEQGASLEVSAAGEDAPEALNALEKLFEDKFGED
ncbi:MAG: HPr family phosphocarrier protein [Candidatus Pacebacteria bacterium]|nr:HPr family phosphocarrier protein [Candidatus Paceibacterota bacterium]